MSSTSALRMPLFVAAALVLGACAGTDQAPTTGGQVTAPPSATASEVAAAPSEAPSHASSEPDAAHDDPSAEADRTIEITMSDIAFDVDSLQVAAGETIRFVFTNVGEARHEAVVGDDHVQAEHAEQMAGGMSHDDMEQGHHGDAPALSLAPGETGELVVTFEEPGELFIGCHEPGHYDAGMVIAVTVTG